MPFIKKKYTQLLLFLKCTIFIVLVHNDVTLTPLMPTTNVLEQ